MKNIFQLKNYSNLKIDNKEKELIKKILNFKWHEYNNNLLKIEIILEIIKELHIEEIKELVQIINKNFELDLF